MRVNLPENQWLGSEKDAGDDRCSGPMVSWVKLRGFMGRWSRRLATEFISWLRIPRGVHWLDAGCGTGALADAVCSHADPASVVCCDPVTPFVEYARGHSRDARQSFMIAGVDSLPHRFRRVRQRYLLARFELLAGPRRRGSRNAVRGCASVHGVRVRVGLQ